MSEDKAAVLRALAESRERGERASAEEILRDSEARYRSVISALEEGILVHNQDGLIEAVNPAARRILGYEDQELFRLRSGDPRWDAIREDGSRLRAEDYPSRVAFKTGKPVSGFVMGVVRGDGERAWVSVNSRPLFHGGADRPYAVVSSFADVTERRRSEQALRESEERYRSIVETTNEWIWAADLDGRLTYSNRAVESILGFTADEMKGRSRFDYLHEDDVAKARHAMAAAIRDKKGWSALELRWRDRSGEYRHLESNAVPMLDRAGELVGWRGASRDITERLHLESQLTQSQKMEAIGRLAGGIAHDFNNLLTTILGYSDLILSGMLESDPLRADIQEIRRSGERAAALTRQLLAFSRKQILQPIVLDVNETVQELEKMLRRLIGEDIEFELVLATGLSSVRADPGQLQQIILNLAVNARDAMPSGGKLTIETSEGEFDPVSARSHPGLVPGKYVCLSVRDNGIGMTTETQSRIFEPFFTTKEKGQGTGLGLSTVYGIVKQSGGYITVHSEVGRGSTFRICLPPAAETATETAPAFASEPMSGVETILLVEDEAPRRALARRALEARGYRILEASSAEEAVRIAGAHSGAIDLMITDAVMPGGSGPDLARRLAASRPAMRHLFVSGYTDDAIVRNGRLSPGQDFLQKPFTPDTLCQKAREVLDGPPDRAARDRVVSRGR